MTDKFVAEVIDVFDPEKSGRLKIRIFGLQDDTNRIPDSDLPWVRCVFPVTNPVHDGVAGPTTGLVKGSIVVGYFVDSAHQIPLITGSLGGVSGGTDVQGSSANSTPAYDFPKADRGEDYNEVVKQNLPSIALPNLKFATGDSIASIQYFGQGISQMLEQIGEGNIIGAIQAAQSALQGFNEMKAAIAGSTVNQINAIVQSFASGSQSSISQTMSSMVPVTDTGTVISSTPTPASTAIPAPSVNAPLNSTLNNLAGNIAPRTSKTPIVTTSDVITRVNGHQFVMTNVMPHLESALNSLLGEQNAKQ